MSDRWTFQGRRLIPYTPEDEVGFEPESNARRMRLAQYERSRPPPTGVPSWHREVPMPEPPDETESGRAPILIIAVGLAIAAAWVIGIAVNML